MSVAWCLQTDFIFGMRYLLFSEITNTARIMNNFFKLIAYMASYTIVFELLYCSDFRCESNGIFVLGVFFFFSLISSSQLAIFDKICFISKIYCCSELKFEKNFLPVIVFCKVMGGGV